MTAVRAVCCLFRFVATDLSSYIHIHALHAGCRWKDWSKLGFRLIGIAWTTLSPTTTGTAGGETSYSGCAAICSVVA